MHRRSTLGSECGAVVAPRTGSRGQQGVDHVGTRVWITWAAGCGSRGHQGVDHVGSRVWKWGWFVSVSAVLSQSCPALCDSVDYIARQAPPSLEFSRRENWSGLPSPSLLFQLRPQEMDAMFQRGV